MTTENTRRLWSVRQAAKWLGISMKTLYVWIESRRIPYVALGSRRMFDPRELEEFIRSNSVMPHKK